MSRDALRLSEITGCMPHEAAYVLEVTQDFQIALENLQDIIASRRSLCEEKLLISWRTYAGAVNNSCMGVSQTMKFSEDLGIDLESPSVLCIAWEMQASELGNLDRERFVDGWARLESVTLDQIRETVTLLRQKFDDASDRTYFRDVYNYTFPSNLSDGGKTMPFPIAKIYWLMLLHPRYSCTIDHWLEFSESAHSETVSRDTWNMLLEFCEYKELNDPKLKSYDESGAWPIVIDDFVEYMKERGLV